MLLSAPQFIFPPTYNVCARIVLAEFVVVSLTVPFLVTLIYRLSTFEAEIQTETFGLIKVTAT